jgi:hypothetical protein
VDEWPAAPKGSEKEITKLTSLLRQYLIEQDLLQ